MEKVMVALRAETADDAWVDRLCGPVAAALQQLDLPGLTINVRDAPVRESMMVLTTLDPPVQALVSLWVQQSYGEQVSRALEILGSEAEQVAAYLVTESAPMPPMRWSSPSQPKAESLPAPPSRVSLPAWPSR